MARKYLFRSVFKRFIAPTNTENNAGAPAYAFTAEHALAQYTLTGCMNATFYASAEDQLEAVLSLARQVSPDFIARLAVYAREEGYMKDLPALLCVVLSIRDPNLLARIFPRVIDNAKMLRSFVRIIRSGDVGRESLGSFPKKLVLEWLEMRSEDSLFRESVGTAPSLADIIKMVHPKPKSPEREAFFGYLLKKDHKEELLPAAVRDFEAFRSKTTSKVPAVPFQMLTSLDLGKEEWKEIARNASWQMTRMNLNAFVRKGVFEDEELTQLIARRLGDENEVKKARAFPYQLLIAYRMARNNVPLAIREELQNAMEIAVNNVPELTGQIVVCPDVSGSMSSPVTGRRRGSSTAVRCIDVAALIAASVMRKNVSAIILPFSQYVLRVTLDPRDSVMTNAQKLSSIGGGGTNCSAPLTVLNKKRIRADLVILVSDNESWIDTNPEEGSATMQEWNRFKATNLNARLACIDIQPNSTTQAQEREDILNVGGFSDHVFDVLGHFSAGTLTSNHFVGMVDKVEI